MFYRLSKFMIRCVRDSSIYGYISETLNSFTENLTSVTFTITLPHY